MPFYGLTTVLVAVGLAHPSLFDMPSPGEPPAAAAETAKK